MRGLSAGNVATQSGGSINGFPNVAIYLDEQSGQLPGRNLDVYAAISSALRCLRGPGNALRRRSSGRRHPLYHEQAEAQQDRGEHFWKLRRDRGGDPNTDITAVLNVPLIADKLACALWSTTTGAAVTSTMCGHLHAQTQGPTSASTMRTIRPGCSRRRRRVRFRPISIINNNAIAAKAIHPVTYQGVRVAARWDFADDWSALITQSYQDMDAEGVFYQDAEELRRRCAPQAVGHAVHNSYNKTGFENTALTINGRIGVLRAV